MRDKHLMQVILGLNVALAAAFGVYVLVSANPHPRVVPRTFSSAPQAEPARAATPPAVSNAAINAQTPVSQAQPPQDRIEPVGIDTPVAAPQLVPATRTFGWREVQSADYPTYMANLRLSGCPEATIRRIVLDDVNQLFAEKRLQLAVANDPQWWRPEAHYAISTLPRHLQDQANQLEEERQQLIARLLGTDVAQAERGGVIFWSEVQLTGPALGRLPPARHAAVQEICRQSIDRQQQAFWHDAQSGRSLNAVESARLREQTRIELRRELNEEEMEEFLLRYSHNASRLRDELRGFDPTPEEFRKIFRVTDPIDHTMQLAYGGPEGLSTQQRERWQRQRDAAIREVLGPDRYVAFLLTKDPLYRRAQLYATQYGASAHAVKPIYEMTKAVESKRQAILNNGQLTPQQKSKALEAVNLEQHRTIQQIVREAHSEATMDTRAAGVSRPTP